MIRSSWFSIILTLFFVLTDSCLGQPKTIQESHLQKSKWIVIASKQLDQVLKPLCDHRGKQGFDVFIVHAEDFSTIPTDAEKTQTIDGKIESIHASSATPTYVLIVGDMTVFDSKNDEDWPRIPAMAGTIARMKGQPTDHAYGCVKNEKIPSIAVGRFPAGTREEVETMVAKTIRFENPANQETLKNRIRLLVGHPGGGSALEKSLAENFIFDQIDTGLETINPIWQIQAAVHSIRSPYFLRNDQFRDQTRAWFEEGQVFTVFFGHSGPEGIWSEGSYLFSREDWDALKPGSLGGVMFSSGCFSCQTTGRSGEGHGLTSMRTDSGPVAVIGATGESYAAAGKWAADAFMDSLNKDQPPTRLGGFFLAAKRGLAESEMEAGTFAILDAADGSRGKLDINTQRAEHLEMWMLLGDPALLIPSAANQIDFQLDGNLAVGKKEQVLRLKAKVPNQIRLKLEESNSPDIQVIFTLERRVQDVPRLKRISRRKLAAQGEIILENHAQANQLQIFKKTFRARLSNGQIIETIKLPIEFKKQAKPQELIVRLEFLTDSQYALGVKRLIVLDQ